MAELVIAINTDSASTPSIGAVSLYPKSDNRFYMKDANGAEVRLLTDEVTITTLSAAAPLKSTGGNNPVLSILNASGTAAGAMSSSDKAKLDAATSINTPSTIILRDGFGNFSAGTITATLSGTATTCTTIPSLSGHITTNGTTNQTSIQTGVVNNSMIASNAAIELSKLASNPLDRSNHTGTQVVSTIAGFDTAIGTYISNGTSGRIKNEHITSDAAIALSKLAVNPLDRANHTGTQSTGTITNFTTTVEGIVDTKISSLSITNTNIATNAAIALSKLAVNPLDRANHTGNQTSSTISDFSNAVSAAIAAGNGIVKSSNQLAVQGTTDRIASTNQGVDISSNYVGQTSITTLGTITSGSWQASIIGVSKGGTGSASAPEAANNLRSIQTLNGNQTLDRTQHEIVLVDTSLGAANILLPSASGGICRFIVKKLTNDANTVTITAAGSDTVEGAANKTLTTRYQYLELVNNGTTWFIVGQS